MSATNAFDEDNTCVPPVLSKYSMNLLGSTGRSTMPKLRQTETPAPTIATMSTPDNSESKVPAVVKPRRYGVKLGLPPKRRRPLAPVSVKEDNKEMLPPPKHEPPAVAHPPEKRQTLAQDFSPPPPAPASKTPAPPFSVESGSRLFYVGDRQYKPIDFLGQGGSSKVYKVRDANQQTWALKRVKFDKFDDQTKQSFAREISLLLKLNKSERVVYLHDYIINEDELFLVMELGERDLAHIIYPRLQATIEPENHMSFVRFFTMEMLLCIHEVHAAGIVHSDLKPANFIFIKGRLKVIDFGIADALGNATINIYRSQQIGTPNYMAPETLSENSGQWKVGMPSDVWSIGCIVYQMVYGTPPYGNVDHRDRQNAIRNPQFKIKYSAVGVGGIHVPPAVLEFLKGALERDPNLRWTIPQCLKCQFVRPQVITNGAIRDIIHDAINFGHRHGGRNLTSEDYDRVVAQAVDRINLLEWTYTGAP